MKSNIRISINDLVRACCTLGETHVVAAGTHYATLSMTDEDRLKLGKSGIFWTYDDRRAHAKEE